MAEQRQDRPITKSKPEARYEEWGNWPMMVLPPDPNEKSAKALERIADTLEGILEQMKEMNGYA